MKKLTPLFVAAVAVISCLLLHSCSTQKTLSFYGMKTTKVTVNTVPSGAKVYYAPNNQMLLVTPNNVLVAKNDIVKGVASFRIEKEGYKTRVVDIPIEVAKRNDYTMTVNLKPLEAEQPQRVSRDNAGETDMERSIIRWNIDSDPRGARVFWRVISSVPAEVKNTNESYLGTTPYEETRGFNILGLTYENSQDVTIEIKVTKRGYEDQIKRFNARMALDQQEISGFFELIPKD